VVVRAGILGGTVGDDRVDKVVEVIVGSGEGVPVDEGGPVVPVATVVVVGRGGGVSREVEVVDYIHVWVHVYFPVGGWGEKKRE